MKIRRFRFSLVSIYIYEYDMNKNSFKIEWNLKYFKYTVEGRKRKRRGDF